jgi:hypothetical protein
MPAKELKKGGKPAQVKGACDIALDENKEFLRTFFAGEAPAVPALGMRIKTLGAEHEERTASAGIIGYGGTRMTNTSMTFGTDTDFILTTEDGADDVVVPKRFLNHRGGVHQNLFKVGDVIFTTVNSCEKSVNIGKRGLLTKGRGWHEVVAWIPADKVARALKEGRLRPLEDKPEGLVSHEQRMAEEAAQQAALDAKHLAEVAAMKAMDAAAGGGGGGGAADEELGTWY